PFLLISVGMIVDVSVLTKGPMALIGAATLTVVAVSGKFLAATATQLVFKYTNSQRNLIFGLSNAHAAATLAVIMVGYSNGIIDENVLNGTIVLILVTCIIASLITENASKKAVLEGRQDDPHLDTVNEKEEQILIPIANLGTMEPILDFATLVKSKKSHFPISILSVVPDDKQAERNLLDARRNLDSMARYASGSETEVEMLTTVDFNIPSGISHMAKQTFADCIIMGWPSATSFLDKIIGEKAESILNKTDANLFMCRLDNPLLSHKSITIFVPPLAELELGFEYWMEKMLKLAQELSYPITFVCNGRTQKNISREMEETKSSVPASFTNYEDWDNIAGL